FFGPGHASAGRVRCPAGCAKTYRNVRIEHKSPVMAAALNAAASLPGTIPPDVAAAMAEIGRGARAAARVLAIAPAEQKNRALGAMAKAMRSGKAAILAANAQDMTDGRAGGLTGSFLDRLELDDKRIEAMAEGLDVIRDLPDPVGKVTESWTRPNGMTIERVRVPLGVVGVIYESRPNVTADAGALTLKAGNAVIL